MGAVGNEGSLAGLMLQGILLSGENSSVGAREITCLIRLHPKFMLREHLILGAQHWQLLLPAQISVTFSSCFPWLPEPCTHSWEAGGSCPTVSPELPALSPAAGPGCLRL